MATLCRPSPLAQPDTKVRPIQAVKPIRSTKIQRNRVKFNETLKVNRQRQYYGTKGHLRRVSEETNFEKYKKTIAENFDHGDAALQNKQENEKDTTNSSENLSQKYTTNTKLSQEVKETELIHAPIFYAIITYFAVLIVLPIYGIIQDMFRFRWNKPKPGETSCPEDTKDFTILYQSYDNFFTRNIYGRVRDCFNKPINGVPGGRVSLVERKPIDPFWFVKFRETGKSIKNVLNLASYNYLGFANTDGEPADQACLAVQKSGIAGASSEQELGRNSVHEELEQETAKFLGTEDALVFGMGFATNSMNIPCLVNDKSLIISDQCNHASIVTGCRLAGATIRVFTHNDMSSLESVLRKAVLEGNPRRMNRPWNKILIIVEGIYSMEGTICNLPKIVELKYQYKAYLYLDEAHSIGAMGKSGRGICEYWNVNPRDVDLMMGTFTKSFGAAGGYIGGSIELIRHLRTQSHGTHYAPCMPAPVAAQTLKALHTIGYTDLGKEKVDQLAKNAVFFRDELQKRGFLVFGDRHSPVVPVLTCEIGKMAAFQRLATNYNLAVVVVGFPATPVTENRIRFCLSAAHSTEDLEKAIEIIDKIGDEIFIKYGKK